VLAGAAPAQAAVKTAAPPSTNKRNADRRPRVRVPITSLFLPRK
jgi:hypothetical protein